MMSRIERVRRAGLPERPAAADPPTQAEDPQAVEPGLPALRPPRPAAPDAAVFAAQLIGQDGQKRGLRAGPLAIDAARGAYNKVEWSGSKDRRGPAGRKARTRI